MHPTPLTIISAVTTIAVLRNAIFTVYGILCPRVRKLALDTDVIGHAPGARQGKCKNIASGAARE
jgi:hypothetical protein